MKNALLKKSCTDFSDDYQINGIDIVKFVCAFLFVSYILNHSILKL